MILALTAKHSECRAHLQGFTLGCISFLLVWPLLHNCTRMQISDMN